MDALEQARAEIDAVDTQLAALFERRMAAVLLAQTGNVNNVWWAFFIAEIVSVLMSLAFYARINKTTIAPLYH